MDPHRSPRLSAAFRNAAHLAGNAAIFAALIAHAPLRAQKADSVTPTQPSGDQLVTLPEFSVSSSAEDGYSATETASGTRLATRIVDLPYSIQVVPQQFFQDFQLFDIDQATPFIAGISPGDYLTGGGGSARLRGFTVPYFVDGFLRRQLPESNDIDRIEVVRGPQSAIYGRVSPGGVINYISKMPTPDPTASVETTWGNYAYQRTELDAAGPVVDHQLFYRVGGAYTYYRSEADQYFSRTGTGSLSLLYKVSPNTSIYISDESTKRVLNDTDTDTNAILRWVNGAGITQGPVWSMPTSYGEQLSKFNMGGSSRRSQRKSDNPYFKIEQRINDTMSFRFAFGFSSFDFDRSGPTSSANWDTRTSLYASTFANIDWVNTSLGMWTANRSLTRTAISQRQYGPQADVTKDWGGNSWIKQRSLLTVDGFEDASKQRVWSLSGTNLTNALTSVGLNTTRLQNDWLRPDPFNPSVSENLPTPTFQPWWPLTDGSTFNLYDTYHGGLINHTVELFNSRLVLTMSGRADWAAYHRQQPIDANPNLQSAEGSTQKDTYSVGMNYHIIPSKLVAYVSYGSGFNPVPQVDQNTGTIYGNRTSKGVDYGLKGVLFDGFLSWSTSFYRVDEYNEATANPANPTGSILTLPALVPGGTTQALGQDISVSGNVTRDLTMMASMSWSDLYYIQYKSNPALIGTQPLGLQDGPNRVGSVALRYIFPSGPLTGARVGVAFMDSTSFLRVAATATAIGFNVPSYDQLAAFAGYSWKIFGRRLDTNLNLMNLTDERHPTISFYAPQGVGFRFTAKFSY